MQSIQITLNTKEDAYNLAIKFGASECTLHVREYENLRGETELGFEFWDSLYESTNQSINQS